MSEKRKKMLKLRQITDMQRATSLKASESWNMLTIMAEFVELTERLSDARPAVSIFGSARMKPDDPYYLSCVDLARRLSDAGFSIISGGGPGIMEAANRGGFEGESSSIGLNIELPHEQTPNNWQNISISFRHFYARKVGFIKYADAFVFYPGGYGTLDELTEAITLIQTGKKHRIPIILVGTEYWRGLLEWIQSKLVANKMIADADYELIQLIDEPIQIVEAIFAFYEAMDIEAATDKINGVL